MSIKSTKSIIPECASFLLENATGVWYESYRLKDPETNGLIHNIEHGMIVLRVEKNKQRAFYWISNIADAASFNEFVGLKFKGEAHELILSPRCRFFYDIDLTLDEMEKHELSNLYSYRCCHKNEITIMETIGAKLANVFKDATIISLQEHGIDSSDLNGFDWMFTMRNRKMANDGFKISIHLITNMCISLNGCSAIAHHVKSDVIPDNVEALGIHPDIVNLLIDSIDSNQYRPRGSLGLPFGTKPTDTGSHTSWLYKSYDIPHQHYFITSIDKYTLSNINLSRYDLKQEETKTRLYSAVSPEFVKEALKHVGNIKDYDPRVFDVSASQLKNGTMYVKRYAPSMCSVCNRIHDNDNTLFLIFNSDQRVARWLCKHNKEMGSVVFYRQKYRSFKPSDGNAFIQPVALTKDHKLDDNTNDDGYESDECITPKTSIDIRPKLINPKKRIVCTDQSNESLVESDGYDSE